MPKKPATVARTRAIVETALQETRVGPLAERIAPALKAAQDALVAHAAACPFPDIRPVVTERWHLDLHYELRQEADRLEALGQGAAEVAWVEEMQHLSLLISLYRQLHDGKDWDAIGSTLGYQAVAASGKLIGALRIGGVYNPKDMRASEETLRTAFALLTPDEVVTLLAYDRIAHQDLRMALIASLGEETETRTPHRR